MPKNKKQNIAAEQAAREAQAPIDIEGTRTPSGRGYLAPRPQAIGGSEQEAGMYKSNILKTAQDIWANQDQTHFEPEELEAARRFSSPNATEGMDLSQLRDLYERLGTLRGYLR